MKTTKRITNLLTVAVVAMTLGCACTSALAEWLPTDTTSTVAWYDADDTSTITLSGAQVTQWNDKSTNAYHATTLVGTAPMYTASDSALNSMGSIGYEPDNDVVRHLNTPTITAAAQAYIVVHWQPSTFSGGGDQYLLNATSPDQKIHGQAGNTVWDKPNGSTLNAGYYYRDGSSTTTGVGLPMASGALWRVPFATRSCTWRMLNDGGPSTGEGWNDGAVGEFVFTDGTEDLETQQTIEGYLAWKWGLQGALPGDHPHKNAPPGGTASPYVQLSSDTVASSAVPGTLVGNVSMGATDGTFAYALESGGANDNFAIAPGSTNLHTAAWMDAAAYNISVVATETGGDNLVVTNDFTITVADPTHLTLKVTATMTASPTASSQLGSLVAQPGSGTSFEIVSGSEDLFEIDVSGTKLMQVTGSNPGSAGETHYLEIKAMNDDVTNDAYYLIEATVGTPSGTILIIR